MKEFWQEFWNEDSIINEENPQLKIGRSVNKKPISKELWNDTLHSIENQLCLTSKDVLLDIGAGSGMISIPFSKKINTIYAVDFSEKLLQNITSKNIIKICKNVLEIDFKTEKFSKIICYFALQHFSFKECIILFEKIYNWLEKDGIVYIGDIPDLNKLFVYYSKTEWKKAYFESLKKEKPIIGTWFTKDFLINLATYCGFSKVEIIEQPKTFLNSHYRFDLKIIK